MSFKLSVVLSDNPKIGFTYMSIVVSIGSQLSYPKSFK